MSSAHVFPRSTVAKAASHVAEAGPNSALAGPLAPVLPRSSYTTIIWLYCTLVSRLW